MKKIKIILMSILLIMFSLNECFGGKKIIYPKGYGWGFDGLTLTSGTKSKSKVCLGVYGKKSTISGGTLTIHNVRTTYYLQDWTETKDGKKIYHKANEKISWANGISTTGSANFEISGTAKVTIYDVGIFGINGVGGTITISGGNVDVSGCGKENGVTRYDPAYDKDQTLGPDGNYCKDLAGIFSKVIIKDSAVVTSHNNEHGHGVNGITVSGGDVRVQDNGKGGVINTNISGNAKLNSWSNTGHGIENSTITNGHVYSGQNSQDGFNKVTISGGNIYTYRDTTPGQGNTLSGLAYCSLTGNANVTAIHNESYGIYDMEIGTSGNVTASNNGQYGIGAGSSKITNGNISVYSNGTAGLNGVTVTGGITRVYSNPTGVSVGSIETGATVYTYSTGNIGNTSYGLKGTAIGGGVVDASYQTDGTGINGGQITGGNVTANNNGTGISETNISGYSSLTIQYNGTGLKGLTLGGSESLTIYQNTIGIDNCTLNRYVTVTGKGISVGVGIQNSNITNGATVTSARIGIDLTKKYINSTVNVNGNGTGINAGNIQSGGNITANNNGIGINGSNMSSGGTVNSYGNTTGIQDGQITGGSIKVSGNGTGINGTNINSSGLLIISGNTTGIAGGKIGGSAILTISGNTVGIKGSNIDRNVVVTGVDKTVEGSYGITNSNITHGATVTGASIGIGLSGKTINTQSTVNVSESNIGIKKGTIKAGAINSHDNTTGINGATVVGGTTRVYNNTTGVSGGSIGTGATVYTYDTNNKGNTTYGLSGATIGGGNVEAKYQTGGTGINGGQITGGNVTANNNGTGINGTYINSSGELTVSSNGTGILNGTIAGNGNLTISYNTVGINGSTIEKDVTVTGVNKTVKDSYGITNSNITHGATVTGASIGIGLSGKTINTQSTVNVSESNIGIKKGTIKAGAINSHDNTTGINGATVVGGTTRVYNNTTGVSGGSIGTGATVYTYDTNNKGNTTYGLSGATIGGGNVYASYQTGGTGIYNGRITGGTVSIEENKTGILNGTIDGSNSNITAKNNKPEISDSVAIKSSNLNNAKKIAVENNYKGIYSGTINVDTLVLSVVKNTIGIDTCVNILKYVKVEGKNNSQGVIGISNSSITKGAESYNAEKAFSFGTIAGESTNIVYTYNLGGSYAEDSRINGFGIFGTKIDTLGTVNAFYNYTGVGNLNGSVVLKGGIINAAYNNNAIKNANISDNAMVEVYSNSVSGITNSNISGGTVKVHDNGNNTSQATASQKITGIDTTDIVGGNVEVYRNYVGIGLGEKNVYEKYKINNAIVDVYENYIGIEGTGGIIGNGVNLNVHNNNENGIYKVKIIDGFVSSNRNGNDGISESTITGGSVNTNSNTNVGIYKSLINNEDGFIINSNENRIGIVNSTINEGTIKGGTISLVDNTERSIVRTTVRNSSVKISKIKTLAGNTVGLADADDNGVFYNDKIFINGFEVGITGGTLEEESTLTAAYNGAGIKLVSGEKLKLRNKTLLTSSNNEIGLLITGNITKTISPNATDDNFTLSGSTVVLEKNSQGVQVENNAKLNFENINGISERIEIKGNTVGMQAISSGTIAINNSLMTLHGNETAIKATTMGLVEINQSTITINSDGKQSGIIAEVENGGQVNITDSKIYINNVSSVGIFGATIVNEMGSGGLVEITNDLSKNPNSIGASGIYKSGTGYMLLKGNNIGLKGVSITSTTVDGGWLTLEGNNIGIDGGEGEVLLQRVVLDVTGADKDTSKGITGNVKIEYSNNIEVSNNDVGIEGATLEKFGNIKAEVSNNNIGIKNVTMEDGSMEIRNNETGIDGGTIKKNTNLGIRGNTIGLTGNVTMEGAVVEVSNNRTGIVLKGNTWVISSSFTTTDDGDNSYYIGSLALAYNGGDSETDRIGINAQNGSTINMTDIRVTSEGNDMVWLSGNSSLDISASTVALTANTVITKSNGSTATITSTGIVVKDGSSTVNVENNSLITFTGDDIGTLMDVKSEATGKINIDNSRVEGRIIGEGTGNVTVSLTNNGRLANAKGSKINKLTTDGTGIIVLNIENNKVEQVAIGTGYYNDSTYDIRIKNYSENKKMKLDLEGTSYFTDSQTVVVSANEIAVELVTTEIDLNGYKYTLNGTGTKTRWTLTGKGASNASKMASKVPSLTNAVVTAGLNSLTRRLGDIRRTPQDKLNGVWTRVYGRNDKFTKDIETKMEMTGAEGGYDRQVMKDKKDRYYVGAMVGYQNINKIETKQKKGTTKQSGEGTAPSAGVYGTWIAENGMFADITIRNFWISLDMNNTVKGAKPYRTQIAISGEFGKEFELYSGNNTKVVIEPKTEWVYSYAGSASSKQLEYGATNSIKGKLGFMLGLNAQTTGGINWQPYMEAGYSYEFDNKTEVRNEEWRGTEDLSGGYGDIGVGLNVYFGKGISGYSLISYEKGSDQENFVYNVGIRYGF